MGRMWQQWHMDSPVLVAITWHDPLAPAVDLDLPSEQQWGDGFRAHRQHLARPDEDAGGGAALHDGRVDEEAVGEVQRVLERVGGRRGAGPGGRHCSAPQRERGREGFPKQSASLDLL